MNERRRSAGSKGTVRFLSPEEMLQLHDKVEKGECLLIYIRGNAEFEVGHIACAKLIPLVELDRRKSELDKDRMVVVYCRTGKRALRGAQMLCDSGFGDVYVLEGGIERWEKLMHRGGREKG